MNKKLEQTISEKDSTIESILETFNSIQLNLLEIQRRQTEIRIPIEGENKAKTKKRLLSQIKLVTTHPANSFSITKGNGNCILAILNSDKFWSASKYMVILIEKE